MKRVALAGAVALLILLVPTKLDAQTASPITFVNAAGVGGMDVYLGLSSDSTVSLGAAGVGLDGVVSLGQLTSGNYRFLICSPVANPAASLAACSGNSAATFIDKNQSIGDDQTAEIVLGVTSQNQGRLSKVNIDTGCVSPGGRITFSNQADSDPATLTLDGTVIDDGLSSGKTAKTTALAGTHTITVADGAALNISSPIDVASQTNTVAYLRGTPNGYAVVAVHPVALACSTPPPNDPGTTGTAPAVNANTTSAVNPKFTG